MSGAYQKGQTASSCKRAIRHACRCVAHRVTVRVVTSGLSSGKIASSGDLTSRRGQGEAALPEDVVEAEDLNSPVLLGHHHDQAIYVTDRRSHVLEHRK